MPEINDAVRRGAPLLALTVSDACRALGCGKTWFYEQMGSGAIKARRLGGKTVIEMTELQRFLDDAPRVLVGAQRRSETQQAA